MNKTSKNRLTKSGKDPGLLAGIKERIRLVQYATVKAINTEDNLKKTAKAHEAYLLKQEKHAAGTISGTIRKISEINSKQRIR